MASTGYQLGVAVELAVVKKLIEAGWFAQRAPRSKGAADVLAIRAHGLYGCTSAMVNCKRSITECYPDDWNATWLACKQHNAIPLVAGRFDGKRGVRFMRMLNRKEPGRRDLPQPWEPYDITKREGDQ